MRAYLYLLFSADGDLAGFGDFLETADVVAAQKAQALLRADRDVGRVEIWQGDRLLAAAA